MLLAVGSLLLREWRVFAPLARLAYTGYFSYSISIQSCSKMEVYSGLSQDRHGLNPYANYPMMSHGQYYHTSAAPTVQYQQAFQTLQDYNENSYLKSVKNETKQEFPCYEQKYYPYQTYSHLAAHHTYQHQEYPSYNTTGSAFAPPTSHSNFYQQYNSVASVSTTTTTLTQPALPRPPAYSCSVVQQPEQTQVTEDPKRTAKRGRRTRKCQCTNCQLPPLPIDEKTGKPRQRKHNCHFPGCNREYGKTSHLKSHIMWHENQRPFECHFASCDKKFTRSDELSRHIKTHTKEHLHKCLICGKGFGRSDHRNKHMKIHSKSHTKQRGRKKKFKEPEEKNENCNLSANRQEEFQQSFQPVYHHAQAYYQPPPLYQ